MTQVEILSTARDRAGAYKVDLSRGERVSRVSSEWFSHPPDERFLSLSELYAAVRGRTERSRTRTVESAAIRVEATALYEALMISSGGMTNRIDRLENARLIERRKHPTDRRGTLVALSERGKAVIDEILTIHIDNERAALSALSEAEQKTLNDLLAKLLKGLSTIGTADR